MESLLPDFKSSFSRTFPSQSLLKGLPGRQQHILFFSSVSPWGGGHLGGEQDKTVINRTWFITNIPELVQLNKSSTFQQCMLGGKTHILAMPELYLKYLGISFLENVFGVSFWTHHMKSKDNASHSTTGWGPKIELSPWSFIVLTRPVILNQV